MNDLLITPQLVGQTVRSATRPDWGNGKVLQVKPIQNDGQSAHRVQVHFERTGLRWIIAPPARLVSPTAEPERAAGWIEQMGKSSLDDRLRAIPAEVVDMLGTPRQRLAALVPLFAVTNEPRSLMRWAIDQTGVTDPLSHWSRDELQIALADFCVDRDSHFRNVAALIQIKEGPEALRAVIDEVPADIRAAIKEAMSRVI
jgi:hypothetical protein